MRYRSSLCSRDLPLSMTRGSLSGEELSSLPPDERAEYAERSAQSRRFCPAEAELIRSGGEFMQTVQNSREILY